MSLMNSWLFKSLLVSGLVASQSFFFPNSSLAQKELCRFVKEGERSTIDRPIILNQFGIQVNIPSNYRAILLNNGTVQIVSPATFEFLSCLKNGGISPREVNYGYYNIRLIANPKNDSVLAVAKRSLPKPKSKYFKYNLEGNEAIILESTQGGIAAAYFRMKGIDGVVEISANCNCNVTSQDVTLVLDQTFILKDVGLIK